MIDNWILKLFTKIAHAVQWATDISCYKLAEHMFLLTIVGCAGGVLGYFVPAFGTEAQGMLFMCIFNFFNGVNAYMDARRAARCAEQWGEKEVLPPEVMHYRQTFTLVFRVTFTMLFILGVIFNVGLVYTGGFKIGNVWSLLFITGLTSALYFMIVTPMPRQRLRKLVPIRDVA